MLKYTTFIWILYWWQESMTSSFFFFFPSFSAHIHFVSVTFICLSRSCNYIYTILNYNSYSFSRIDLHQCDPARFQFVCKSRIDRSIRMNCMNILFIVQLIMQSDAREREKVNEWQRHNMISIDRLHRMSHFWLCTSFQFTLHMYNS